MNLPEDMQGAVLPENLPIEDKWILSLYNDLIKNVTSNLDSYELGVAVQNLFDFIWMFTATGISSLRSPVSQRAEKQPVPLRTYSFTLCRAF